MDLSTRERHTGRALTSDALDGGHGRPGTAEPAGLRWEAGWTTAPGTANAAPPGRARPGARKPRAGVAAAGRSPSLGTSATVGEPRAEGSQTARTGRVGLGAPLVLERSASSSRLSGRRAPIPVVQGAGSPRLSSTRSTPTSTRTSWRRYAPGRSVRRWVLRRRRCYR